MLNYDVFVRRDLANNHSLRWDAIYDSHSEANLKGKTQTQCYYYHQYGHMASACPMKQQRTKKGGWEQKKPILSLLAIFVPQGLKGSVQYSTGVKYASWDVPTAIINAIDQAVVVTTQENTAPVYPETKIPSVPDVKLMLSRVSSNFIISLLESKAVSQPSVLSPEALGINASLHASMSTKSVCTSLCSVTPTVDATSSSSGHCYREGKFGGVFTPIPKSVTTPVNIELLRGYTAGPFLTPPFKDLHCSPGCRPKKDGSYTLIMDLSFPLGQLNQ